MMLNEYRKTRPKVEPDDTVIAVRLLARNCEFKKHNAREFSRQLDGPLPALRFIFIATFTLHILLLVSVPWSKLQSLWQPAT